MKLTNDWLKEKGACAEGVAWFKGQKETDLVRVLKKLLAEDHFAWANWTICRVFDYKQRVQYAVFAAEQVLNIFERKYPEDKRPRKAIEAAKKCIDDPSDENKKAAAAYAAYAAAADAAAYAAYAAAAAAYAAADAAAYAAYAAADAAAAAAYARKELKTKILNYGISLLQKGKK